MDFSWDNEYTVSENLWSEKVNSARYWKSFFIKWKLKIVARAFGIAIYEKTQFKSPPKVQKNDKSRNNFNIQRNN